jgi:3-oxoacyl-[acyl-carrier protein] reductase
MDLGLDGRTAIVCGASSGMGLAIAETLAAEGANVAMFARRRDVLEREADRIGALAVRGDVTVPADLERLVERTLEAFGGIDIVVLNSGGPAPGPATAIDDDSAEEAFALVLLSAIRLTRLALPHLRRSKSGRIVAITSGAVKEPSSNLGLSNTMRPGVHGYLKSLANELGPEGITVNCVAPGRIETARLAQLYPDGPTEEQTESVPLRR